MALFNSLRNAVVAGCLRTPLMVNQASNPLPYRGCGASGQGGVADVTYSMCDSFGYVMTTLISPTAKLTGFRIDGDLGADGQGAATGGPLPNVGNWSGFYKTVDDGSTGDPTVNHVVLVNRRGWTQTFPTSTNNDSDIFQGPGATQIIYILFADPPGNSASNPTLFARLMVSAINGCAPPENTCFAGRASTFMGPLYTITGITPGGIQIADGGNDMYVPLSCDHGRNILKFSRLFLIAAVAGTTTETECKW